VQAHPLMEEGCLHFLGGLFAVFMLGCLVAGCDRPTPGNALKQKHPIHGPPAWTNYVCNARPFAKICPLVNPDFARAFSLPPLSATPSVSALGLKTAMSRRCVVTFAFPLGLFLPTEQFFIPPAAGSILHLVGVGGVIGVRRDYWIPFLSHVLCLNVPT